MLDSIRTALTLLRARLACAAPVREESGQGTTEYALLVGLLVVVAIVAIIAVGPVVEALWGSISDSMGEIDVK